MKQITPNELSNLLRDYKAWASEERITKGSLTTEVEPEDGEDPEFIYYLNQYEGVVRIYSEKYGIAIKFNFFAKGDSYEYKTAYEFHVFSDFSTLELMGFELVSKNGKKLPLNVVRDFIASEIYSCWESGVRRLLPTLPDKGE